MWVLEALTLSETEAIYGTQSQAASQAALYTQETTPRHTLKVGTFTIGRKDADILVVDKSVSRKHAEISISYPEENSDEKEPILTIKDLGSTFGTLINVKDKIGVQVPRRLFAGDSIRIGQQSAAFRILWEPLVLCITRMTKKEKVAIRISAKQLGAQVVEDWSSQVTHLVTTKDLAYTVKVMVALILCVPVVHMSWVDAVLSRTTASEPIPLPSQHILPSTLINDSFRNGEDAHKQRKHLNKFCIISLVPRDEGEDMIRVSGATLFRVYPSTVNTNASTFNDIQFEVLCNILKAPPAPLTSSLKAKQKKLNQEAKIIVESRASLTFCLLTLPNGATEAGGKSGRSPEDAASIKSRFEMLSELLPVVSTSTIAQSLLNLDALVDVKETEVSVNKPWIPVPSLLPPPPLVPKLTLPTENSSKMPVQAAQKATDSMNNHSEVHKTKPSLPSNHVSPTSNNELEMDNGNKRKETNKDEKEENKSKEKIVTKSKRGSKKVLSYQADVNHNVEDVEDEVLQKKNKKIKSSQGKGEWPEMSMNTNNKEDVEEEDFDAYAGSYIKEYNDDDLNLGEWHSSSNKTIALNPSQSNNSTKHPPSRGEWGDEIEEDDDMFISDKGCKPVEEEITLTVVRKKKNKSNHREGHNVPNFKRFRKNHFKGDMGEIRRVVQLERVFAEENERVKHMRSNELQQEEFEERSNRLFCEDGDSKRGRTRR